MAAGQKLRDTAGNQPEPPRGSWSLRWTAGRPAASWETVVRLVCLAALRGHGALHFMESNGPLHKIAFFPTKFEANKT